MRCRAFLQSCTVFIQKGFNARFTRAGFSEDVMVYRKSLGISYFFIQENLLNCFYSQLPGAVVDKITKCEKQN